MLDFGFYNMDCMEGMKEFPDKYFDLAIVDPPYGGGGKEYDAQTQRFCGWFTRYFDEKEQNKIKAERRGGTWASKYGNNICTWDFAPTEEYFKELFRISKNQIIWGGNYFTLPATRCFIVWRKSQISEQFTMSMCEYAWTSFNSNAKVFEHPSFGGKGERFHPTQKPVALYRWILANYAKQGDKLLDTHVGSASSLIAFEERGFDYVGFEIDADYYQKAQKRLEENRAQISMDFLRKLP